MNRTARQRRLIAVAGEIAQMAHEHDGTVEALYDAAAKTFFGAVDVSGPGSHLYGTDEALMNYLVSNFPHFMCFFCTYCG